MSTTSSNLPRWIHQFQSLLGGTERAMLVEPAVGERFPNPSPLVDDAAWMAAIEADDNDPVGDIAPWSTYANCSKVAEGAMLFQTLHSPTPSS